MTNAVIGLQFEMGEAEGDHVFVRTDQCGGAFRRDVRTLGYMRREERSLRGRQRDAPMIDADDVGLTCSAGEVGIRSGRSGMRGASEKNERRDHEENAFHRDALSIAASTSSHIPPVTGVTNLP
jgi:hypothetical protein